MIRSCTLLMTRLTWYNVRNCTLLLTRSVTIWCQKLHPSLDALCHNLVSEIAPLLLTGSVTIHDAPLLLTRSVAIWCQKLHPSLDAFCHDLVSEIARPFCSEEVCFWLDVWSSRVRVEFSDWAPFSWRVLSQFNVRNCTLLLTRSVTIWCQKIAPFSWHVLLRFECWCQKLHPSLGTFCYDLMSEIARPFCSEEVCFWLDLWLRTVWLFSQSIGVPDRIKRSD